MSTEERTGKRDLTYSAWHRERNLLRYGLTRRQAYELGLIDIDGCEYCRHCWEPLALIETQVSDKGPKPAVVTSRLARNAGIAAFSVSIQVGDQDEIALFRVQQIEPASLEVQPMLPHVFAYWLYAMREQHAPTCAKRTDPDTPSST